MKDPYIAFNFRIEIDDVFVAGVSDVTGLVFETEVETFRAGGVNDYEQQLPGAGKFPSKVVLKRGLADVYELWDWYEQIAMGDVTRKNVSITLIGYDGEEKSRWTLLSACPTKWTGPELKGQTSAVAFETMELIHRGLIHDPLKNKKHDPDRTGREFR